MTSGSKSVWFWQYLVSPHMAGLASALARRGWNVTYVAQQSMSADRARQGWLAPATPDLTLRMAVDEQQVAALVAAAPSDAIHICQGVRANGVIGHAQALLANRGLPQWTVLETVNDRGWRGVLRRAEYRRIFWQRRHSLQGVLAIGHATGDWIAARGVAAQQIVPFAYFLPDSDPQGPPPARTAGPFRFAFAGQLIPRKRVDWLLRSLAGWNDREVELWIVGAGPEESRLRSMAAGLPPGVTVRWCGQSPMSDIPALLGQADCLVLPSAHDGWGAVASEALMAGTPVICSNACGVAGAVTESGVGGTFAAHRQEDLEKLLAAQWCSGPIGDAARRALADWSRCLGAGAGARYLDAVLGTPAGVAEGRPPLPWQS